MQATIERTQTPTEQAQEALDSARSQLAELEGELSGMPGRLQGAADGTTLLKLRQRSDELKAHRDFANRAVARGEIQLLDAQIAEQASQEAAAAKAIGEAQGRYGEVAQLRLEVETQHRLAMGDLQAYRLHRESLEADRRDKRAELASLTSEAVH